MIKRYEVIARDPYGNTTVLHEVYDEDEATELEIWEGLNNPEHYIFVDTCDAEQQDRKEYLYWVMGTGFSCIDMYCYCYVVCVLLCMCIDKYLLNTY